MSRAAAIVIAVDQSMDVSELMRFIPYIPVNAMQTFIKTYIQNADDNTINKVYHNTLSIDRIIPHDIIQNILSFNPLSTTQKAVNKTFKALSDKNTSIQLRQRNEIIKNIKLNLNIEIQSTCWVIDPNRNQLNDEEVALGYKGIFNTLEETLVTCQCGDTLMLYDGTYSADDLFDVEKSLSLIGLSNNVIIKFESDESFIPGNTLYFKSVQIIAETRVYGNVTIENNGHLWMEQCRISGIHICVRSKSTFGLQDCYFAGRYGRSGTYSKNFEYKGLDISPLANAQIIACTFTGCGDAEGDGRDIPCIEIESLYNHSQISKVKQPNIAIIGNIFTNNKGRSIVYNDYNEAHSEERLQQYQRLIESNIFNIHSNLFQNRNLSLKYPVPPFENPDPNQVYLGIHDY